MAAAPLPVKTPEGQAELTHRHLKLNQRQRTLLLLVDGRRSEAEVRRMGAQAGVPEGCFDELCTLGLISMPRPAEPAPVVAPPVEPPAALVPAPVPAPAAAQRVEPSEPPPEAQSSTPAAFDSGPTPLAAAAPTSDPDEMTDSEFERELAAQMALSTAPNADDDGDDYREDEPPLPAALALEPDSPDVDWRGAVSLIRPNGLMDLDSDVDDGFDEARALLIRAVRDAAPVAGSFTLIRLRRSRSRADLVVLLDDVEARILKPPGAASGMRTMRRVRELLELPDTGDRLSR